jgi:hypothetical protein
MEHINKQNMSWGIDFTVDVFIRGQVPMSIFNVQQLIQTNNQLIEDAKKRIQMFVSATPKDIIDPEWKEQPIDWLVNSTEGLFEEIETLLCDNVRLQLYIDYLEKIESTALLEE